MYMLSTAARGNVRPCAWTYSSVSLSSLQLKVLRLLAASRQRSASARWEI